MTNKATKRALLTSIMAFIICAVMLIGTTFAWFTDSVVSGKNQIVAGNLDVELYYDNDETADWTKVASDTNVFKKNTLWEPGHTEIVKLKVANEGSLALKYQFMLDVASETEGTNVAGDTFKLSDYIMFGITTENVTTREAAIAAVKDNAVKLNEGITDAGNLKKGEDSVVTMVVYMPTTVDNVANHKTGTAAPTIDFGLKLLATQYTYESDSFNNLYDENATYGKTIYLDEGADLLAALAEGDEDLPLTVILNGNVNYTTDGHHGEDDVTPASDVVIDGQGKYGITFTGAGVTPVGDSEASLTLKNLTVNDETVSYEEKAWEFSYLEMGSPDLTCTNVTFNDPISVDSKNATFMSCTFTGYEDTTNIIKMYGVWMYNGDATFTGCTFNGTRGMKICDMYTDGEVGTVVIDGCTFNSLTQKPGVVIDDEDTQDMKITIKNSLFVKCQPGDQGLYVYETDNTVPTVENNTVINDVVNATVSDADSLYSALTSAGSAGAGTTLVSFDGGDIDLTGETWTPIKVDGYHGADKVILDGNGATIKGLSAPLFAGGFAGESGIVIKNLTIADSNIVSSNTLGSGAFIESVDSMELISLDNCHLVNSTVTGGSGSRTGGLIGWTAGYNNVNDGPVKTYVTINNCSVVNCEITCDGSVGGIYGHAGNNAWTYSTVSNCTVKNCKLTSTDDGGWRVGVVVGTANVGEMTIENITESGNTLSQTGKTAPAGQSNLYGRFVPSTTGKLVIDGTEIK